MEEKISAYRILVGKPPGRRQLGKPRHRWRENITTDLTAGEREGFDLIALALDWDKWRSFVIAVMNLRVP
jgi:hypothetical protein